MRMGGPLRLVLLGIGLATLAAPVAARADEPKGAYVWEGTLTVGTGAKLRIVFHVTPGDKGEPKATFDSPDQGVTGWKVDEVTLDRSSVVFDIHGRGMR